MSGILAHMPDLHAILTHSQNEAFVLSSRDIDLLCKRYKEGVRSILRYRQEANCLDQPLTYGKAVAPFEHPD